MTIQITTPSGTIFPGKPVLLYFTPDDATYVRVWCHAAPPGSRLRSLIDEQDNRGIDPNTLEYYDRSRVKVFEGKSTDPWLTTFEKGGKYTLYLQAYTRNEYGGGYEHSPASGLGETLIGAEQTETINVAQQISQTVGVAGHTATLSFWAVDDAILSLPEPKLSEPRSQLARIAVESTTVTDAVAALAGKDLTDPTTVGTVASWSNNLYAAINAHLDNVPDHANADTDNVLTATYATTPNESSLIAFVNAALRSLRQHVTNDAGTGPDSGNYHTGSDLASVPLYTGVRTLAEAYGAIVDLQRCFDEHQHNETVHAYTTPYPVNELTAIQAVHSAFLSVLADPSEPPPAQQSGTQILIANAGFVETPL